MLLQDDAASFTLSPPHRRGTKVQPYDLRVAGVHNEALLGYTTTASIIYKSEVLRLQLGQHPPL
eukprot:scaffold5436_cov143-Skeletonema_menzelii.AAC.2